MRIADKEDMTRAVAQGDSEISADFAEVAMARGDHCAAAFDGDRMISYAWRTYACAPFHADRHCDVWLEIAPPFRYGYKALTLPEFRGLRLQDQLIGVSDELCLRRGLTHALGCVETHNFSSLRADKKRGTVLSGYVVLFHIAGKTFLWRSPGARAQGIRLFNRAVDAPRLVEDYTA